MTPAGLERIYTLRVRFGGNPDEVYAVVAGAAAWLFRTVDPSGRHPLQVTVTDTEQGEALAQLTYTPANESGPGVCHGR